MLPPQGSAGPPCACCAALHRANDGIGNHNPQKGHVREGPHQCQAKRQHDKNQIEKRKNIIPNDLGFAPVGEAAAWLSSPAAMRWAACSAVRPLAGSVSSSGTCGRSGCGWAAAGCLPAGRGNCNFDKALSPSFYNNIGMSFYYKRDCMNKYSAHSIIPDFIYALNFALAAHSSRALAFFTKKSLPNALSNTYFPAIILLVRYGLISSAG